MSAIRLRTIGQHAPAAGILLVALLATWFAYSQGITGSTRFDDRPNLNGLVNVDDAPSAWRFILSGRAGPLGRPLALATFVPEAHAWPNEPGVFLRTNILIHLLNGVLVTWLLYLLGTARQQTERQAALVATGSGALWMMMPILASSTFLIVQRMTTLSAAFVLLGAIGYLYARRTIARRPISALCGMTVSLGLGCVLGALSKESGVLLLMFVLAIEGTLLRRPAGISPHWWRTWFSVVLILPTLLLAAYLATRLPYSERIILVRDFSGFERLITQAGILWKYLYLAFVPNLPSLGPFHDDQAVQRSLLNLPTLLAICAWVVTIIAAILLRRKAPLIAFAVAWYLMGHILESTTIALELYFEHRNYLPLVGPAYAVVATMLLTSAQWRRVLVMCVSAYILVLGGVLYSVASLWGSPAMAAEMWYIYKPTSIRAAEGIAEQMERQGDLRTARKIFREVREHHPDAHYLDLQILLYSCFLDPDDDHSRAARELENKFQTTKFSFSVLGLLQNTYNAVRQEKCRGMAREHVYKLGQSVMENPRFNGPATAQVIHTMLARIAIDGNEVDVAMEHIDDALSVNPDPETLIAIVTMLNAANLEDAARSVLAEAHHHSPKHPLRSKAWSEAITSLEQPHLEAMK